MDAFLVGTKKSSGGSNARDGPTVSQMLSVPLLSENNDVSAFYAQLSEREQFAHKIAVEKLGTSYDVTRTHGFLKWLKKRQA
jgi:hypothetical protein